MRTETAIKVTLEAMPDRVFIAANGYISRWAWMHGERRVFPMLGSMGLAQSIALGVGLANPDIAVGILNGDGNLLMEPSATFIAGHYQRLDLAHFCFNNRAYQSTGGQPTLAKPGMLAEMAKACGYRKVETLSKKRELARFCASKIRSPVFCEVLVDFQTDDQVPRRVEVAVDKISLQLRNTLIGRVQ